MSIDALLAQQKAHRLSRLYAEADRLGMHRQAWARLSDMADASNGGPVARAVMDKIRDAHLRDSTPTAVVLSSLLADVVDFANDYRKKLEELVMNAPLAPIFIPTKDNKDEHDG